MNRRLFLAATLTLSATGAASVLAQTRPAPAPPQPALIDLNSASRDDLMTLDGIGEVRAEAIIRARPFKAKTELVERRLIPEALYDRINDKLTVRAPPGPARPPTPTVTTTPKRT